MDLTNLFKSALLYLMDKESQKVFDLIVKKNPEDLTLEERQFLFARRTYLNHQQEELFKKVLAEEAQKVMPAQEEETLEPAKKK